MFVHVHRQPSSSPIQSQPSVIVASLMGLQKQDKGTTRARKVQGSLRIGSCLTDKSQSLILIRFTHVVLRKEIGLGQIENADVSDIADIADFFSPTFINPCFRYSPIVNIENLDFKNPRFQTSV